MKTRITRTLAGLALATALLSGSSATFAATPDLAVPALYDLGDIGSPIDLGPLGGAGNVPAHVTGAMNIANGAGGVVPPAIGSAEAISSGATATGLGIASAALQGAGIPGLPFALP